MTFITAFIFWLIGLGLASFTLIPIAIIIVFGIPTTKKLEGLSALKKGNNIIKHHLISLAILLVVFIASALTIKLFFPGGFAGFLTGAVMAILFGLGRTGANRNNVSDYIETNKRHLVISPEEAVFLIISRSI